MEINNLSANSFYDTTDSNVVENLYKNNVFEEGSFHFAYINEGWTILKAHKCTEEGFYFKSTDNDFLYVLEEEIFIISGKIKMPNLTIKS